MWCVWRSGVGEGYGHKYESVMYLKREKEGGISQDLHGKCIYIYGKRGVGR